MLSVLEQQSSVRYRNSGRHRRNVGAELNEQRKQSVWHAHARLVRRFSVKTESEKLLRALLAERGNSTWSRGDGRRPVLWSLLLNGTRCWICNREEERGRGEEEEEKIIENKGEEREKEISVEFNT